MVEQGISEEIVSQFDFNEPKGAPPEPIFAIIDKMDQLLTKEQRLAVMLSGVCITMEMKKFGVGISV